MRDAADPTVCGGLRLGELGRERCAGRDVGDPTCLPVTIRELALCTYVGIDLERIDDESLLAEQAPGLAGPSFAAFYRRHERAVLAFHLRRVGQAELAADLMAETFAQALNARGSFTADGPGSGAAWLYGIARNVLGYSARRADVERRGHEALAVAEQLGVGRVSLTDEQRDELALLATEAGVLRALDDLPPPQRDAVRAFVLDDTPYPEIAANTGVAEPTIRKRVSRGLAALRSSLEESR